MYSNMSYQLFKDIYWTLYKETMEWEYAIISKYAYDHPWIHILALVFIAVKVYLTVSEDVMYLKTKVPKET